MRPVPESVRRSAEHRLSRTVQVQAIVEEAIRSGRPLDAEQNQPRKLAFIEQKLGVTPDIAARIAAYEDPKSLPLTPEQAAGAESLQGKTVDFVGIRFLDIGRAASRSVARVTDRGGEAVGTGFMVAPNLFLTNNHVIESRAEAGEMLLEFNYEEDANRRILPVSRFRFNPTALFLSDDITDLDFTLVAVGARVDGAGRLEDFGYLPLVDTDDKHIKAIFVNVIQHPDGRPKELVTRENRIFARTTNTLIYGADTLPGSSGSPILNDDWEVIALHHWGGPSRARREDPVPGVELPSLGNEGIRISVIVKQLRTELPRLDAKARALLATALDPSFRAPSLARRATQPRREVMRERDIAASNDGSAAPRVSSDGTVTWTVPLTLSVRLGGIGIPTSRDEQVPALSDADVENSDVAEAPDDATVTVTAEAAKLKPDANYANRRGYNASFLGIKVPLPTVRDAKRGAVARNQRAKAGENAHELKYLHFSAVMNAGRRLAYFTAVNIDGRHVVKINRETGVVTSAESLDDDDGAEAREKWYGDPRLGNDEATDQSLYDDAALGAFQRGHLVKRTDPSWGVPDTAAKAQADTYHFTNCAPQHEKFNPVAKRWAGLENWITNGSDDEDMRVSVFTGPIFGTKDPKLGYVRVPLRYWKIVVRVEDGRLLATAAVADQTELVKGGAERIGAEDLPRMPQLVKVKQVTVAKIEALTGIDFGKLRNFDTSGGETLGGGAEALGEDDLGWSKEIERLEDYQIRPPAAMVRAPHEALVPPRTEGNGRKRAKSTK